MVVPPALGSVASSYRRTSAEVEAAGDEATIVLRCSDLHRASHLQSSLFPFPSSSFLCTLGRPWVSRGSGALHLCARRGGRAVRLCPGSPSWISEPACPPAPPILTILTTLNLTSCSYLGRPSSLGILCACQGSGFRPDPIISARCHSPSTPYTVQNPIVAVASLRESRLHPEHPERFPLFTANIASHRPQRES